MKDERNHDDFNDRKKSEALPSAASPADKDKQTGSEATGDKKRKLTRKERKQQIKQQAAYEKQLVKEGKIAPRYRYTPRNGFGRILSVCIAFVIGFFAAFGTLVGGFWYAGSQKISDVTKMVGGDYTAIFTETAADMSALQLVTEIVTKAGNGELNSMSAYAAYTPVIESTLNAVAEQIAEIGVNLDVPALMAVDFANIGAYFSENVIMTIALADVLHITDDDSSNSLMRAICYQKGKKLTISDLTDPDGNIIRDIALADVLSVKPDDDGLIKSLCFKTDENGGEEKVTIGDLMDDSGNILGGVEIEVLLGVDATSSAIAKFLAYGSETELVEQEDGTSLEVTRYTVGEDGVTVVMQEGYSKNTLNDLVSGENDLLGNVTIGDIVTIDENSSNIMQAMKAWTINDLTDQNKIQSLKISDVIEIDPDAEGLMGAISGWTLGELNQQSRIERLKIGQIVTLGENPSKLMTAISDWRITDLTDQSKIEALTLSDVITIDEDSAKLLVALQDTRLGEFSEAIDTLSLSDILGDTDMEGNKLLKHLKDSTLLSLTDDIAEITVAEVFSDEIYSYMSTENGSYADLLTDYLNGGALTEEGSKLRPTAYPQNSTIVTVYEWNGRELEFGYFSNGRLVENAKVGTRKTESGGIEKFYYYETQRTVTPNYEWFTVDYENGGALQRFSTDGVNILSDSFSYYYETAAGERVDLERKITGYELDGELYAIDGMGDVVIDGTAYRVYTAAEGESYILYRTEGLVGAYYYAESGAVHTVGNDEVAVCYYLAADAAHDNPLERYLSGAWYLLFGGEEKNEDGTLTISDSSATPILEFTASVSEVTDRINSMTLAELYFHELIDENPYQELPEDGEYRPEGGQTNLNELTIAETIRYVQQILANS